MRNLKILFSPIIILAFAFTIASCFLYNTENKVYKYYKLTNVTGRIIYSEKQALNNLVIVRPGGSINILSIPFSRDEYNKHVLKLLKADQNDKSLQPIELEISGRMIKALKKDVNQNECFVTANDYNDGVAIYITYFGTCNLSTDLKAVLKSIKYLDVKDSIAQARSNFLSIMNIIEKMHIPIFDKAYNIQSEYNFLGCTKRTTYNINASKNSNDVIDLYKDYFLKSGWKPYGADNTGNWFEDKLFYTWIDSTGEVLAKLVITSDKQPSNTKMFKQTIYIDVAPYIISRWPTKGEKEDGGR